MNIDTIKIRELEAKATPAPWREEVTDDGELIVYHNGIAVNGLYMGDMEDTDGKDHKSAELIVYLRNHALEMVEEIERLREALRDIERDLNRAIDDIPDQKKLSGAIYLAIMATRQALQSSGE